MPAPQHCTHEARGLDILPQTIHRFRSNGDAESADLLQARRLGAGRSVGAGGRAAPCMAALAGTHEFGLLPRLFILPAAVTPACLPQDVVYAEEISHVAAGVRWLRHLHAVACGANGAAPAAAGGERREQAAPQQQAQPAERQAQQQAEQAAGQDRGGGGDSSELAWVAQARRHASVERWFHALIRGHFRGPLKPPFNDEARAQAGFGPEWYLPLAVPADEAAAEEAAAEEAAAEVAAAEAGDDS